MKTTLSHRLALLALLVLSSACFAAATQAPAKPAVKAPPTPEPATVAKPRDEKWVKRHEGFNEIAKKGGVDLLFVGDSITDGWRGKGKDAWEKYFAPLKAANFGIGGDRTQHVLWRLQNGNLNGISPKLAVLMIGTNNLSNAQDADIAAGVTCIVKEIQKRSPKTKVLLLAIFPRGEEANNPARPRIKNINSMICKLDDGGKTVKYMDIGSKFLDADGKLPKDIMYDFLHCTEKGYQIWADAIKDTVTQMLK